MNIFVFDSRGTEYSRSVDGHASYAYPFLHDLQPNDQLDTTTNVEVARAYTKKHSKVGLGLGHFPLQFGDVPDVLELCFGLAKILASFPTKAAKDVTRFVLAAHLHEPTWGLGEDPNDSQEEDEWEDLERNWEAPDEGAVTTCVEFASTLHGREPMPTTKGRW